MVGGDHRLAAQERASIPDEAWQWAERALVHIRVLAEEIGPRPSTGVGERRAADYAASIWRQAGLLTSIEPFRSGRSTYRPYALAFAAGLVGTVVWAVEPGRLRALLASALNGLGAWAFFCETEFRDHWARRLAPHGQSQNVVAVVPPTGPVRQRVVIYGHLDTHRTPVFYSSPRWLRAFSGLVGVSFLSLIANTVGFGRAMLRGRGPLPFWLLPATGMQLFALAMTLHADRTPYTPGANDNASGAASVLALGERLARQPLNGTEVWVVANGCEEVGAYGIAAFLEQHRDALHNAVFIDLDMVGIGFPTLLLREGLLLPARPDRSVLALARKVAAHYPGWLGGEHRGGAYTDTGVVVRRGFRGLTIDSQLPTGHPAVPYMGYWHQQSDTVDKIELPCLARVHAFVWAMLQAIDEMADGA